MLKDLNWKHQLLNNDLLSQSEPDEFGIYQGKVEKNSGIEFHDSKPKGANLRELSQFELHQAGWETPFYQEIISTYLEHLDPQNAVVADLGCGDGRFTQFLLEQGFQKVIALDAHHVPLQSLAGYLKKHQLEEKVLLIHSSLDDIPIEKEQLDALLAINVFYYMGEKTFSSMQNAIALIKQNAIAIITEHNYEAILLRALMFNGLEGFMKVATEQKFKETDQSDDFWFPVKKKAEIRENWEKLNLEILDEKGITIFHQFLNILRSKNQVQIEEIEENLNELWNLFKYLHQHGSFNKTTLFKLQKR